MASVHTGSRRPGARAALYAGRVSPGERLAAGSGLALVVLMAFDWFAGRSAWQLGATDVLLLAIALLAVALAASRAAGRELIEAPAAAVALTVAGGVATGAMLTLVLESSGGTVPLVASLVAAGGILLGGVAGLRGAGR